MNPCNLEIVVSKSYNLKGIFIKEENLLRIYFRKIKS